MKKLLCIVTVFTLVAVCILCTACGPVKQAEIYDFTKGYFEGNEQASSVTINLDDYVSARGKSVTYCASSANTDVASVELDGSKLTVTMLKGEGESVISVEVNSRGRKAVSLSFTVTATQYKRVACIGDSLTYGHSWHNQSYPVYLQELLGDGVDVQNFGVNGSAVTNRSDNTYKLKYDTLPEYSNSLRYDADIVVIMLGSNDGWDWTGAESTFVEEYEKLIESYFDRGAQQVILLTSPPALEGNFFNIPNDVIVSQVYPKQQQVAELCGVPIIDVHKVFNAHQDMQSLYRLPVSSDGVHLSVAGAQLVANLVADFVVTL